MKLIRKISIGPDVLKAMNFSVGQPILRDKHKVTDILKLEDGSIEIWLSNLDNEVYLWKSINQFVPVTIEYNIDFE